MDIQELAISIDEFTDLAQQPQYDGMRVELKDGLPVGPVPFAPDLAVEVVSGGNTAADMHETVLALLNAGTRLIWQIYPESQTVMVYTPSDPKLLSADDHLSGEDVLAGFQLLIKDMFS